MPEYLHPGVYIQEESSGAKPIEAAGTSTGCFIGETPRGPDYKPTFITSWAQFDRIFGGLLKRSEMPLAVRHFFLNGGAKAYIVRVVPGDAAPATGKVGEVTFNAKGAGTWGNVKVDVTVDPNEKDSKNPKADGSYSDCYIITVRDPKIADDAKNVLESFAGLSGFESGDRFYAAVINRDSLYLEVPADASGNFVEPLAAGNITLEKGADGDTANALTPGGDGTLTKATDSLGRIDDINILCVPGAVAGSAVAMDVSSFASNRADLIYVMDGPGAPREAITDPAAVKTTVGGHTPQDAYTACYFPWVTVADPYSTLPGATRYAAPSGFIAGLFARTDRTRGVWKAPAGTEASLLGAVGLPVNLSDSDQDILNPIGVNCIRQFPSIGVVCWGTRTLATVSNPEYRYVPIRRFTTFLETSLKRGTKWVVFEPNDEPLWSSIRFNINAFMLMQFRAGALQGSKPDEAYFVKCDKDNNIQATIDAGQVHILVAFAPLKPAEFVIIHIQQKRKE